MSVLRASRWTRMTRARWCGMNLLILARAVSSTRRVLGSPQILFFGVQASQTEERGEHTTVCENWARCLNMV